MSGRLEVLHALAWTLPDVQPGPVAQQAFGTAGMAADGWQLCEGCDGEGVTRDKFGRESSCSGCGGAGRYRVDSFTGLRVSAVDSDGPSRTRRLVCDRCGGSGTVPAIYLGLEGRGVPWPTCPSCDGAGSVSVLAEQRDPVGVGFDGSELSRRRETGDWARLEWALAVVAQASRPTWRLWVRVRVQGERVAAPSEAIVVAECDRLLLNLLPDQLRCPKWARDAFAERHKRADAVEAQRRVRVFEARGTRSHKRLRARELVTLGYSVAEAAELAGCSVRTVQRAAAA